MAGALGRMGRVACAAVSAAPDLELVAGFARQFAGEPVASHVDGVAGSAPLFDDLESFYKARPEVVVDLTVYPVSLDVSRGALDAGASPVIGATGWMEEDVVSFTDAVDEAGLGAMMVPNFSVGAVVMMRLCELAAPFFDGVEIVEMHHDRKKDKPSGTAWLTAERIGAVTSRNVPIHSVRLPGLVAHQSVLFGTTGQTLEIRHDSLSRDSFVTGMLLAVRNVRQRAGLTIGLDALLFGEHAGLRANPGAL